MFLWVWLLLALLSSRGALRKINETTIGDYTMVTYYNTEAPTSQRFMHVHTSGTTLYFVGTVRGVAKTGNVVCEREQGQKIPISPRGCDATSKEDSIEGPNCAGTLQQANEYKETIEALWSVRPDSDECVVRGGDRFSCLGPVYLAQDNDDLPRAITNETLLTSRAQYIVSGDGPMACSTKSVVEVDVELPKLEVTTDDCVDDDGASFAGTYEKFEKDAYSGAITDVLFSFRKETTNRVQRFLIRRRGTDDVFSMQLASADGVSSFQTWYTSNENVTNRWAYSLPLTFSHENCSATISLVPVTLPLTLRPVQTVKSYEFSFNRFPTRFYTKRVCNWHIGCLDELGFLCYPWCTENEACGGHDMHVTPGRISLPRHVDADATYASYVEDCEMAYPWDTQFPTFVSTGDDGALQARYVTGEYSCYAPFFYPAKIVASSQPEDEKFDQCFMLFGRGARRVGSTHCGVQSDYKPCPVGWVYFYENCYKRFDALRDASYKVSDSVADEKCRQLHPLARVLRSPIVEIESWLRRVFVGYKRTTTGSPFRVAVDSDTGGRRCECYGWETDPDRYTVVACPCETPNFPVCRYPHYEDPVPHIEVSASPVTRGIRLRGQRGVPWDGRPGCCECENGWTGCGCEIPTCPFPIDFSLATIEESANSVIGLFFGKCYFERRGSCLSGNVRSCACNSGYGPQASLLPLSPYYKFRSIPCACPKGGGFIPGGPTLLRINDDVYDDSTEPICGGKDRGWCEVETSTTFSRCNCNLRTDLNPRAVSRYEPAWNGKSCDCRIAMLMPDGFTINTPVTEGYCNSHGTCCSSGEIQRNERVRGQDVTLRGRDECTDAVGNSVSGCVCDNGFAGEACTCVDPFDEASALVVYRETNLAYVDLLEVKTVTHVRIATPGFGFVSTGQAECVVTLVDVSDSKDTRGTTCKFTSANTWYDDDKWICPSGTTGRYVRATTLQSNPSCRLQVYSENFDICGYNPNAFAARFFANEYYRGYRVYGEPQSVRYAPFGCTNTVCMCGADHTGDKCRVGISARRPSLNTPGSYDVQVCGETTEPKRGKVGEDGCDCFGEETFEFFGKACECSKTFVKERNTLLTCAGQGTCVNASFTPGSCGYDVADAAADPLASPFTRVVEADVGLASFTFQLRNDSVFDDGNGDMRSVIAVNKESWFVSVGQVAEFDSLTGLVETCGPRIRFPLNMTFDCPSDVPLPERAIADVEIWSVNFTCADPVGDFGDDACYETVKTNYTCDPAGYGTQEYVCPSQTYCKEEWVSAGEIDASFFSYNVSTNLTTCIGKQWWKTLDEEDGILLTGRYEDVWMMCAKANQTNDLTSSTAYGTLDCSSPVDRNIDDGLAYLGYQRQCTTGVRQHSNVFGEGYGLFWNKITDLSFVQQASWTTEHYRAIGSILNHKRCSSEVWTGSIWDEYVKSWVENALGTEFETIVDDGEDATTTLTLDSLDARPENYLYRGTYGSVVLGNLDTWPTTSTANYTFTRRSGLKTVVPEFTAGSEIRRVAITARARIGGLQVVGPRGKVCATILRTIEINETVTADCVEAFRDVPKAEALYAILYNSTYANKTEMAEAWAAEQTQSIVWFYEHDWYSNTHLGLDVEDVYTPFLNEDFALVGRNFSYSTLFEQLRFDILSNHSLPFNQPYYDNCTNRDFTFLDFDYENDVDRLYLRNFWQTHLAPRRCTNDKQCLKFSRGSDNRCIPDSSSWTPWYNGDETVYPLEGVGNEGGCKCFDSYALGFWSRPHFCRECKSGYGVVNQQEWSRLVQYQTDILTKWPEVDSPVYNASAEPFATLLTKTGTALLDALNTTLYCRLPVDSQTSRETKVCGGKGRLSFDSYTDSYDEWIFPDEFGESHARRCKTLLVDGAYSYTLKNDTDYLELMTFKNGSSEIVVIESEVYKDGTELTLDSVVSADERVYDGVSIACRYGPTSETHSVERTTDSGVDLGFLLDAMYTFFFT